MGFWCLSGHRSLRPHTLSGRAMSKCFVRKATLEDAGNAIEVLRASISELCAADHKNDEATMARWLGNKTTEVFASWIYDSKNHVVVGIFEGELKGVGLIETSGDLRLCYVHPDRQRVGVARLVVAKLEAQARQWGVSEIRLTSSANARGFYEHLGYVSAGEPIHEFGVLWDFPYRKTLV